MKKQKYTQNKIQSDISEIAGESKRPDEEDRLLGLFSDEPELIDEITESAMKSRENDPLRYRATVGFTHTTMRR